jgi:hypothetical protein
LLTSGTAAAEGNPGATEEERLMLGPFWVEDVNVSERTVTVRAPDGAVTTLNVSPNATGFDNLKRGDRVDIDCLGSVVIGLTPSAGTSVESVEPPPQP